MTPTRKLLLLAILVVVGFGHQFIFFSHQQFITVRRNDAPAHCTKGYSWRRFPDVAPYRSSAPEFGAVGYCGSILTDKGFYLLPDEGFPISLHQPRPALQQRLKEGCRYRVFIVGYGRKARVGQKPRVPIRQTISRILEERGCD